MSPKLIDAMKRQIERGHLKSEYEDPFQDSEVAGMPELAPASISPEKLALLAALLDPAECRTDDPSLAFESAWCLLLRSQEFAERLRAAGRIENFPGRHSGFTRLILNHVQDVKLSLIPGKIEEVSKVDAPLSADGAITVCGYLRAILPLEGKNPSRKSWSSILTIRRNFNWYIVWATNIGNVIRANAASNRARSGKSHESSKWEWLDPAVEVRTLWEQWSSPACDGWIIPRSFVRAFVRWYRDRRTDGVGLKQIKPFSREDVENIVKTHFNSPIPPSAVK